MAENSQTMYFLLLWLTITITLMGTPFLIKSLYRACTYKSRAKDRERASKNVEEITRRCAEARRGNDPAMLNRIIEANRMDYSDEAASTVGSSQIANELREIKQRVDRIDSNMKDSRDWLIYNPYKGK